MGKKFSQLCTHNSMSMPCGPRNAADEPPRRTDRFFASLSVRSRNLLTFFGSQACRMGEKEMSERSSAPGGRERGSGGIC